jgi:hypothetical protein
MQMNRLVNAPPSIEALPSMQRDVPTTLALDIVTHLLLAPDATRRGRARWCASPSQSRNGRADGVRLASRATRGATP